MNESQVDFDLCRCRAQELHPLQNIQVPQHQQAAVAATSTETSIMAVVTETVTATD
ncbi:6498_t:CDS:2 [Ambispora gerdemannii]|uniref:6498_t:CDS:1 n=1 Tax=Ambispora gerdemannii TaxID=144530 RepID=A0A9N9BKU4_9GLOM|nr:6498_t:CDS:2 [Ambispora gerdemannii]